MCTVYWYKYKVQLKVKYVYDLWICQQNMEQGLSLKLNPIQFYSGPMQNWYVLDYHKKL